MERTQMIPVCTVVESLAGRDKGHLYVVVGSLAYPYVWIADGRKYNLDKPKKKELPASPDIGSERIHWKRWSRENQQ